MITPKLYEIGCQLLLITIRKSHTGFRLVPTSMTLNGVIALILRFSPNSIALLANYVTIVEDKPIILSAENHDEWADPWAIILSPSSSHTFGHN